MSTTATVEQTTTKYQTVTNEPVAQAVKRVFDALANREGARKALNDATKAYNESLVVLPSIYLASDLHDLKGNSVAGLLALADLPESREQSMRYYLRGGRVMFLLANDGKTSPAKVMTAVNAASQKSKGIRLSQIDEIIDELEKKEGATWADFVTAVESNTIDKTADNAIKALEGEDTLNEGHIARIQRLLAKHTK